MVKHKTSPTTRARQRARRHEKAGTEPVSSAASHWKAIETRGAAQSYGALRKAGATKKAAAMIASKHKDPGEALDRFRPGRKKRKQ